MTGTTRKSAAPCGCSTTREPQWSWSDPAAKPVVTRTPCPEHARTLDPVRRFVRPEVRPSLAEVAASVLATMPEPVAISWLSGRERLARQRRQPITRRDVRHLMVPMDGDAPQTAKLTWPGTRATRGVVRSFRPDPMNPTGWAFGAVR